MIQNHLKPTQDRQKSYANLKRQNIEFSEGIEVFIKVSPMRGVMCFRVKGKLAPSFIGPFKVMKRIGEVAYQFQNPEKLVGFHNVFHVLMLKPYVHDSSHIVSYETLEVSDDATLIVKPVCIIDTLTKKTQKGSYNLVEVQWS